MDGYIQFADALLDRLVWTSIQATALIGAVWLLCRWLPRWSPAMRCLLWWLVGLQLMLGLALGRPLELPLLAPPGASAALSSPRDMPDAHGIAILTSHAGEATGATPITVAGPARPMASSPAPWPWRETLAAVWLIGMALQAFGALRDWRETRALVRAAEPVGDPVLQAQCAQLARELGLRRCPALRRSEIIVSPQVTGLWRPVVLLPAEHTLDPRECAMALAHELAHLRRGDLWLAWIPALAQRAFFFHPLARWAMREYAFHREAACDAQVLDRFHAEPKDYGRLLLRLGVAFPLSSGLAGASPTFGNLKRRLTMLQQTVEYAMPPWRAWALIALVALAGVLPYRVTARGLDVNVHIEPEAAQAVPAAPDASRDRPAAPASAATAAEARNAAVPAAAASVATMAPSTATPLPGYRVGRTRVLADIAGDRAIPPPPAPPAPPAPRSSMPPAPPAAPAPIGPPPAPPTPPAPPPPFPGEFGTGHVDIDLHDGARTGYVLLDHDRTIMNGDRRDLEAARHLRSDGAPMLLMRRGTQTYVIRDPAFVRRAGDAIAPLQGVAREQAQLASRQGRLAGQEGGIGARMGALGARQAELAGRRAAFAAERASLASAKPGAQEPSGPDAKDRIIDSQFAALDEQQRALGEEQQALSRQQMELSRSQSALSQRQQETSAQVERTMQQLLDEALAKGVAVSAQSR